jgi:hypothetical protein
LAGDWQAARETQLVLPETGVCNGPGLPAEDVAVAGAVCCGKPREAVAAS